MMGEGSGPAYPWPRMLAVIVIYWACSFYLVYYYGWKPVWISVILILVTIFISADLFSMRERAIKEANFVLPQEKLEALELLNMLYAADEINEEEYLTKKKVLLDVLPA
jgi:uncharacterized membrane protein